MNADHFPILVANSHNQARVAEAIEKVANATHAGTIRNVDLQETKSVLSRAADEAWKRHVAQPHFYGRWDQHPEEVQALYDEITIMGLHDVISASKKLGRSTAHGQAVDAMRTYCAEVLPLSHAVAALKDKVVKGRIVKAEPTPANPNKITRTCPVCFRQIALTGQVMAHHGYKRPRQGWQTASCPGVRFRPLEVSKDGLQWLVGVEQAQLAKLKQALEEKDTKPEFLVVRKSHRIGADTHRVERGDPQWAPLFERHIAELESEIKQLERQLPELEAMLAKWAPTIAEGE